MAQSFHRFSSLPPELRLLVWENALVDRSIAGVNFFQTERGSTSSSRRSLVIWSSICVTHCECRYQQGLAMPHGKRSTSEEDSNLWVTCRESRDVMKRMMKNLNRQDKVSTGSAAGPSSAGGQSQRIDGFPRAVSGVIKDHQSKTRPFTFMLKRDLFVLSSRDLHLLPTTFTTGLDIDRVLPGQASFLKSVDNLAFEIDSHWLHKMPGKEMFPIATVICSLAWERAENPIFYLIDYRLRRKREPTRAGRPTAADRPTTARFKPVNGRFFEVKRTGPWGYCKDALSTPTFVSIFKFVTYLRMLGEINALHGEWKRRFPPQIDFRILAYEPDGDEGPCTLSPH